MNALHLMILPLILCLVWIATATNPPRDLRRTESAVVSIHPKPRELRTTKSALAKSMIPFRVEDQRKAITAQTRASAAFTQFLTQRTATQSLDRRLRAMKGDLIDTGRIPSLDTNFRQDSRNYAQQLGRLRDSAETLGNAYDTATKASMEAGKWNTAFRNSKYAVASHAHVKYYDKACSLAGQYNNCQEALGAVHSMLGPGPHTAVESRLIQQTQIAVDRKLYPLRVEVMQASSEAERLRNEAARAR